MAKETTDELDLDDFDDLDLDDADFDLDGADFDLDGAGTDDDLSGDLQDADLDGDMDLDLDSDLDLDVDLGGDMDMDGDLDLDTDLGGDMDMDGDLDLDIEADAGDSDLEDLSADDTSSSEGTGLDLSSLEDELGLEESDRIEEPDFEEIRDVESEDELEKELASFGTNIGSSSDEEDDTAVSDDDELNLLDDDMSEGGLELDEDIGLSDDLLEDEAEEDLSLENEILGDTDEADAAETDGLSMDEDISLDDDMDSDLESMDEDMGLGDEIESDETDLLDEDLANDLALDDSDDGMMMDDDEFSDDDDFLAENMEETGQSIVLDESMEVRDLEPEEINEGEDDSLLPDLEDGLSDLDTMEEMVLDPEDGETGDLSVSDYDEAEEPVIELSEVPFEEGMDLGTDMFSDDSIAEDDIELSELEEMDDNSYMDDSEMDLSESIDEDQSSMISLQENTQVGLYDESREIETESKSEAVIDKEILFKLPHQLTVELGKANLKGEDITNLTYGSVIELNRKKGEPVDIILGSKIIANGEVVQINEEQLGVRITRINY